MNVKEGINIQNHQMRPAGAKRNIAKETKIKPRPMNMLLIAFSSVGSFCFLRLPAGVSCSSLPGARLPLSAWDTTLMSVPHWRQKLALSRFSVPHRGQNIFINVKQTVSLRQVLSYNGT